MISPVVFNNNQLQFFEDIDLINYGHQVAKVAEVIVGVSDSWGITRFLGSASAFGGIVATPLFLYTQIESFTQHPIDVQSTVRIMVGIGSLFCPELALANLIFGGGSLAHQYFFENMSGGQALLQGAGLIVLATTWRSSRERKKNHPAPDDNAKITDEDLVKEEAVRNQTRQATASPATIGTPVETPSVKLVTRIPEAELPKSTVERRKENPYYPLKAPR